MNPDPGDIHPRNRRVRFGEAFEPQYQLGDPVTIATDLLDSPNITDVPDPDAYSKGIHEQALAENPVRPEAVALNVVDLSTDRRAHAGRSRLGTTSALHRAPLDGLTWSGRFVGTSLRRDNPVCHRRGGRRPDGQGLRHQCAARWPRSARRAGVRCGWSPATGATGPWAGVRRHAGRPVQL